MRKISYRLIRPPDRQPFFHDTFSMTGLCVRALTREDVLPTVRAHAHDTRLSIRTGKLLPRIILDYAS